MLYENLYLCPGGGAKCSFNDIKDTDAIWLILEAFCFYLYIFSAVFYIAGKMIISSFVKVEQVSDFKKAVLDIITYASINLTWFSINFVLVTLPPICIYFLDKHVGNLELEGRTGTYHPLMFMIWAIHLLTFLPKMTIYSVIPRQYDSNILDEDDDSYARPSNDQIDA